MIEAISIRGLGKDYGDFSAVNDLDLDVGEGDVYGFIGPNGAGKTTTIKAVVGASKPTRGEVLIRGRKVSPNDGISRSEIGYIPETTTALYSDMRAIDFVTYVGRLKGQKKDSARSSAEALLAVVGMDGAQRRRIRKMSTGMKQRVNIAQALIGNPSILIADEPTLGLDPVGKQDLLGLVRELRARGSTILISSHILDELERVISRVAVITKGELTFVGTQEQLRETFTPDVYYLQAPDPGHLLDVIEQEAGLEVLSTEPLGFMVKVQQQDSLNSAIGALIDGGHSVEEVRPQDSPLRRLFFESVDARDSQDSFDLDLLETALDRRAVA